MVKGTVGRQRALLRLPGFSSPSTRRPGMVMMSGFAAAVALFTPSLMVPAAAEAGEHATFREALFTATSAVCVTGLIVVDTPSHCRRLGPLGGLR